MRAVFTNLIDSEIYELHVRRTQRDLLASRYRYISVLPVCLTDCILQVCGKKRKDLNEFYEKILLYEIDVAPSVFSCRLSIHDSIYIRLADNYIVLLTTHSKEERDLRSLN